MSHVLNGQISMINSTYMGPIYNSPLSPTCHQKEKKEKKKEKVRGTIIHSFKNQTGPVGLILNQPLTQFDS